MKAKRAFSTKNMAISFGSIDTQKCMLCDAKLEANHTQKGIKKS